MAGTIARVSGRIEAEPHPAHGLPWCKRAVAVLLAMLAASPVAIAGTAPRTAEDCKRLYPPPGYSAEYFNCVASLKPAIPRHPPAAKPVPAEPPPDRAPSHEPAHPDVSP